MKPVDLYECIDLGECCESSPGSPRVDREQGYIRNVKLLGWSSANGRRYDPKGVNPQLYEGRPVNTDHVKPGQEGSVRDTIGWLEGVKKKPDGLYADRLRLLNPSGEYEQKLMAAAENAPHLFGLSHTARGRMGLNKQDPTVEAVEAVKSVDIVRDPATVSSLYESRTSTVKMKLSKLCESLKAKRPKYASLLSEMAEAGILSPSMEMDPPAEAPPEEAAETDHEQALLDAASAVLMDAELDTPTKLKKIKEILKIVDGEKGGDSGGGGPPFGKKDDGGDSEDGGEDKKEEGKRYTPNLREELARLKARDRLRDAADEAGVRLGKALLESISPAVTDAQIKGIIAELKGSPAQGGGQRPRSAGPVPTKGRAAPVTESRKAASDDAVPDDPKAAAKWLSGK